MFIMCIEIIRNNSLVGGHARIEARTPATECVMLYCTWRPSALTTRPHGQVSHECQIRFLLTVSMSSSSQCSFLEPVVAWCKNLSSNALLALLDGRPTFCMNTCLTRDDAGGLIHRVCRITNNKICCRLDTAGCITSSIINVQVAAAFVTSYRCHSVSCVVLCVQSVACIIMYLTELRFYIPPEGNFGDALPSLSTEKPKQTTKANTHP